MYKETYVKRQRERVAVEIQNRISSRTEPNQVNKKVHIFTFLQSQCCYFIPHRLHIHIFEIFQGMG